MGPTDGNGGAHLHPLLKSGRFSDLQISCEGREFAVHKAILCTQSPVLSAACEGSFEESRTNVIKIEEFNAETVERMLDFLYSGDYTVPKPTKSSSRKAIRGDEAAVADKHETASPSPNNVHISGATVTKKTVLSCHLSVNAIGDYYDIQPLCLLARSKLKIAVDTNWSPDDFLHLLTEAYTTRKTGDAQFHLLMGEFMAKYPKAVVRLQSLDGLDMPGSILRGVIETFTQRQALLQNTITHYEKVKTKIREAQKGTWGILTHELHCRSRAPDRTLTCTIKQDAAGKHTFRCARCGDVFGDT